jgi:hypothetical protein
MLAAAMIQFSITTVGIIDGWKDDDEWMNDEVENKMIALCLSSLVVPSSDQQCKKRSNRGGVNNHNLLHCNEKAIKMDYSDDGLDLLLSSCVFEEQQTTATLLHET